ncbi:MAG: hypothetical protein HFH26_10065 [Clostridiaceae bacterium]|nr:hypothetical protein [Clostridiaceae bacterium]
MEQDRSFGYTVILGVCVAASAVLLGRMALYEPAGLHRPHAAVENAAFGSAVPETENEITLTGAELTTLLRAALPENTPVADIRLSPHADGTVEASGSLEKGRLQASIGEVPRTLLLLMPDRLALRAVLSAGCDRSSGLLRLSVESVEAGGFGLPHRLSEVLSDQLSAAANQALAERGIRFSSVRISEDRIAFSL